MSNLIYDILKSQITREIDQRIEKLGVRIKNLLIEEGGDLKIKVVLVTDSLTGNDASGM